MWSKILSLEDGPEPWSFIAKTVLSIRTDLLKPTVRVLITAELNLVFVPSAPAVTEFEQTEINFKPF